MFILFVVILQVFLGYLMVLVESSHPESQFQSIGQGVYWAVVTMTTVGYGDVVPQTVLGRLLAAVVMLLGFGIIAIPTGIVSYEAIRQGQNDQRQCSHCGFQGHRPEAEFCDRCGSALRSCNAEPYGRLRQGLGLISFRLHRRALAQAEQMATDQLITRLKA